MWKRLVEKDNKIEAISSKASKRIQVLEANWNKAEVELCRLDELVDNVRSVLVDHDLVKQDKTLTKLLAVIDGRESMTKLKKQLKSPTEESKPSV